MLHDQRLPFGGSWENAFYLSRCRPKSHEILNTDGGFDIISMNESQCGHSDSARGLTEGGGRLPQFEEPTTPHHPFFRIFDLYVLLLELLSGWNVWDSESFVSVRY